MLALLWRTIKDRRLALITYTGIAVLLILMYVGMFPSIQEKSQDLEKLLQAYPQELMKAFGLDEGFNFTKLENFLAAEQYSLTWPILVIAFMVSWGGSAIAGEIEKGTVELLLSQPLSRTKLFFSKYFSGLIALLIFAVLSILAVVPFAEAYNIKYQIGNHISVGLIGFLFGWTILALSMMFSSLFSERGKAYFLSAGLVVVMYIINIVANLKENLQDISHFSLFHYFDSSSALISNKIDNSSYLVFAVLIIIFTTLGAVIFNKRDITVS